MRLKTTLAVVGSVLALPGSALAATATDDDSHVTGHDALRASGRLTLDADAVGEIRHRGERRPRREKRRSTASPALQAIAACESGGNPAANTGNGFYGKYQFTVETWQSLGGRGNPAAASEAEQDRRAAALYARAGSSPWPTCG